MIGIPKKKNINIGKIVFTDNPENYCLFGIGTCLAIYLFSDIVERYMIAHTLLPTPNEYSAINPEMPAKYTDIAIKVMVKSFCKNPQISINNLRCKIVGGSVIFKNLFNIGEENINIARRTLTELKIRLEAEDVGGFTSRSILTFLKGGNIAIKKDSLEYLI